MSFDDQLPMISIITSMFDSVMIKWTPVEEYSKIINDLNKTYNLGFSEIDIKKFIKGLPAKSDPMMPVAPDIWLDGSIGDNWKKAIGCLASRLRITSQIELTAVIDYRKFSTPNSVKYENKFLGSTTIDIKTLLNMKGSVPSEVLKTESSWPALELIWLLAFNPKICEELGGTLFPPMLIPGLELKKEKAMPIIYCVKKEIFIRLVDSDCLSWASMPMYAK